jgi:hypothetical protein
MNPTTFVTAYILHIGALFFLKGMVRYNALLLLLKGYGKPRMICTALILLWFTDFFVLVWLVDVLSIVKSKEGLNVAVRNVHLLSVEHMVTLPRKVTTKTWWRLLRKRKPDPWILSVMRWLVVIGIVYFGTSYFTIVGPVVWQMQWIRIGKLL